MTQQVKVVESKPDNLSLTSGTQVKSQTVGLCLQSQHSVLSRYMNTLPGELITHTVPGEMPGS